MKGRNLINQAEQKCMKELICKICNHEESDVVTESMADIDSVVFQVSLISFLFYFLIASLLFFSSIMCSASPVNVLQRSPGTLL